MGNEVTKGNNLVGLTGPQLVALGALISGMGITDAADAAGVTRQTVSRWLNNEAFQRRLQEEQLVALSIARGQLYTLTNRAIDVLQKTVNDGSTPQQKRTEIAFRVLELVGPVIARCV